MAASAALIESSNGEIPGAASKVKSARSRRTAAMADAGEESKFSDAVVARPASPSSQY